MAYVDGENQALWFLDTRVRILVSATQGEGAVSVLRHRAPFGDSPPLHIHLTEDEIFYVLDGRVRFRLAEDELDAGSGDTVFAPKGIRTPIASSWARALPGSPSSMAATSSASSAHSVGLLPARISPIALHSPRPNR